MSSLQNNKSRLAEEERIKELKIQLQMARDGTHPRLLAKKRELEEKNREESEMIEINYELTKRRITEDHQRRLAQNRIDLDKKLKDNRDNILKEIDEQERQIEIEYNNSEIGRIHTSTVDTGKKTLRGRAGGVLIEPPTYFNINPKPTTPSIVPQVQYLLSDAEIQADMRAISQSASQASPNKAQRLFEVSISRQKLQYDGKAFKQTEEVMVENREYGKFPARMDISEAVVSFKATQAWDTRQIHASYADLVEGRVQVAKKRNN